jgi:hypothetical protein
VSDGVVAGILPDDSRSTSTRLLRGNPVRMRPNYQSRWTVEDVTKYNEAEYSPRHSNLISCRLESAPRSLHDVRGSEAIIYRAPREVDDRP